MEEPIFAEEVEDDVKKEGPQDECHQEVQAQGVVGGHSKDEGSKEKPDIDALDEDSTALNLNNQEPPGSMNSPAKQVPAKTADSMKHPKKYRVASVRRVVLRKRLCPEAAGGSEAAETTNSSPIKPASTVESPQMISGFGESLEYRCADCGIAFASPVDFLEHNRILKGRPHFFCEPCAIVGFGLEEHRSRYHRFPVNVKSLSRGAKRPFPGEVEETPNSKGLFPPLDEVSGARNLEDLLNEIAGETRPSVKEDCKEKDRKPSPEEAEEKPFVGSLPFSFKCPKCQAGFHVISALQSHVEQLHPGVDPLSCHLCPKSYLTTHGYLAHLKKSHNVKPLPTHPAGYLCDECGQHFRLRQEYAHHCQFFRGTPHLYCEICQEGVLISDREMHVRTQKHRALDLMKRKREGLPRGENFDKAEIDTEEVKIDEMVSEGAGREEESETPNSEEQPLEPFVGALPFTFKCPMCQSGFHIISALLSHVDLRHPRESALWCHMCPKKYRQPGAFWFHLKSVHEVVPPEDYAGGYKCDECGGFFRHRDQYAFHCQFFRGNAHFYCEICQEEVFMTGREMHAGTAKHRSLDSREREGQRESPERAEIDAEEQPKTEEVVSEEGTVEDEKTLPSEEQPEPPTFSFKCPACEEGFHFFETLQSHVDHMHPGVCPLLCQWCPQQYRRPSSFWSHLSLVHAGIQPKNQDYKCDECGRAFSQRHHYDFHCEFYKEKPHLYCQSCQEPVYSSQWERHAETEKHRMNQLKEEMKPFVGTLPFTYKCSECGEGFHVFVALQQHMDQKHFDPSPLSCPVCPAKYLQEHGFWTHLKKVHKLGLPEDHPGGYKCDECGGHFRQRNTYAHHCEFFRGRPHAYCLPCKESLHLDLCERHGKTARHRGNAAPSMGN